MGRAFVVNEVGSSWDVLRTESLCVTPWLEVNRETVATPSRPGGVEWTTVVRPTATVIAPRTTEGNYLLIRQERIPVRREMWEFPAGQVDGNAEVEATARRELGEEAGVSCPGPLVPLGLFFPSCGFTTECCHLFLAPDIEPAPNLTDHGALEAIHEVREFSPDELCEAIGAGVVSDANTLATFARLQARGLFR